MITAVLCPGPSLRGFLAQPAAADTYIGVNHAAEDFACHYWAANDAEAIAAYKPTGAPCLFTSQVAISRLPVTLQELWHTGKSSIIQASKDGRDEETLPAGSGTGQAWEKTTGNRESGAGNWEPGIGSRVLLHEQCRTACPSDRKWNRFTLTSAMILAEAIGSTSIRMYGCDQHGGDYFKAGHHPKADHFADRWASEKAIYSRVTGWLRERRVHVERCFVD